MFRGDIDLAKPKKFICRALYTLHVVLTRTIIDMLNIIHIIKMQCTHCLYCTFACHLSCTKDVSKVKKLELCSTLQLQYFTQVF